MTRQFWRRNLAHLIGWVVVVVGVTTLGVANALPGRNTVDSGDIINGQVKQVDIAGRAVAGAKVKNGSLTGADIRNGSVGVADVAPELQPLFARVTGTNVTLVPVLAASRGVKGVAKRELSGGYVDYLVTFNRSVANCAWTGTLNNQGGFGPGWGEVTVESDGKPDNPAGTTPKKLRVRITDLDNNFVRVGPTESFSVIVQC